VGRRAALAVADQRVLHDLAERRRKVAASEFRLVGNDQHVRVDQELLGFERTPLGDRKHHEREVDVAGLDEQLELVVEDAVDELDVHLRPRVLEAADDGREDPRADALVAGDAQGPRFALREGGEVGLGGLHARDDRVGVAQQQLPGLRQRHRPRPARPLDEPFADGPLESLDLLANRGLRVAEPDGGAAERALTRDRLEGQEVAQLDAE
jgi:hypothetical protein